MTIIDRYAGAVRATSLKSSSETMADGTDPAKTANRVDILGAAGFAAKRRPLALALARLFAGDNKAAAEIVGILAVMVDAKSWQSDGANVPRVEAEDIARKVLAWHRDGVCKACSGHGFELVHGAPSLSGVECKACKGSRRKPFDREFAMERLHLARWLREKIEAEQAGAGAAVMAALAPRLNL